MVDNLILALQQKWRSLLELHREIPVTESKTESKLITKIKVMQSKRPHISHGRKTWCSVIQGKAPQNDSWALFLSLNGLISISINHLYLFYIALQKKTVNKFNGFNINSFVFLSQQDCLRIHCNSAYIFYLKLIVPHTLLILNTSFVSALCSIKALSDSKMLTQQKVDITHSHPKNLVL